MATKDGIRAGAALLLCASSLAGCTALPSTDSSFQESIDTQSIAPQAASTAPFYPAPAESAAATEGNTAGDAAPVVYMTTDISPDGLRAVYDALEWTPRGRAAVEVSTGEPPASNYLRPELIREPVQSVDGTIATCTDENGSHGMQLISGSKAVSSVR